MNQLGNTSINPLHGSCKTQKPSFNLPGSGFCVACMIIFLNSIFATNSEARGGGGTLGISGWGCAAGSLEPLTYTRASSAEFCYPILE